MRKQKTLFVLGAGASKPFGFPVGDELRTQIINEPKVSYWLRQCGCSEEELDRFRQAFKRSGFSIDAFLARRQDFDRIGRLAISAALLPKEDDSRLYFADGVHGNSDWYQSLWLNLVGDAISSEELFRRDVKFITFNYDRSLERYLHLTVMDSFGLNAARSFNVVKHFMPYHMYGQLGPYEQDTTFQREPENIAAAAENLKVMPSARPEMDEVAYRLLVWAEHVFFVGFRFDPMNCARLGLPEAVIHRTESGWGAPMIKATGYGLNEDERRAAGEKATGDATAIEFVDATALGAMRLWRSHFE